MNNLEIRQKEIDFIKLIKMNLDRKEWGKKYSIFTSGFATVMIEMTSFDFRRNKAYFEVSVIYKNDKFNIDRTTFVEFFQDNMTIKQFKLVLYKTIKREIESAINVEHKCLADKNIDICKKYSTDVTEEDIQEFDLLEEWEEMIELNNNYIEDAIDSLKYDVADKWNERYYYRETKLWMNNNPFMIEDLNNIVERIDKFIEKMMEVKE